MVHKVVAYGWHVSGQFEYDNPQYQRTARIPACSLLPLKSLGKKIGSGGLTVHYAIFIVTDYLSGVGMAHRLDASQNSKNVAVLAVRFAGDTPFGAAATRMRPL